MFLRLGNRDPALRANAAFLTLCAPQAAYDWLSARPIEFSGVFSTPRTPGDAHLLEYILLRRREPLIALGLAKFGRSRTVLRRLYRNGGAAIRTVLCGNASLFGGDDVDGIPPLDPSEPRDGPTTLEILQNGSDAAAAAFCSSPHHPSQLYDAALHIALAVPERRGLLIVRALTENPRLRTERHDSPEADYLDGFSEYEYNRVFYTAWGLAENAPTTPQWAGALANLFAVLPRGYGPNADVGAAIARWRNIPPGVKPGGDHSPASYVRSGLARNLKPDLSMLEDDDAAMRRALYGSFNPQQREFRELDWTPWLDRDPHSALIALEGNDQVWRTADGRQKLFGLLREDARRRADYVQVGWAKSRELEIRKKHPDWFLDEVDREDVDRPNQEVLDRIEVLEQRLQASAANQTKRGAGVWTLLGGVVLLFIGYLWGSGQGY